MAYLLPFPRYSGTRKPEESASEPHNAQSLRRGRLFSNRFRSANAGAQHFPGLPFRPGAENDNCENENLYLRKSDGTQAIGRLTDFLAPFSQGAAQLVSEKIVLIKNNPDGDR